MDRGETETEQQPSLDKMKRKEADNREDIKQKEEENLLLQQQILQLFQTEKDKYVCI